MKHLITLLICLLVVAGGVLPYDMDNLSLIDKYTQYRAFDFGFGFGFGSGSGGTSGPASDGLLLENNDHILLESADNFLME